MLQGALPGLGDFFLRQRIALLGSTHQATNSGGFGLIGVGQSEVMSELMGDGPGQGPNLHRLRFNQQNFHRRLLAARGLIRPNTNDRLIPAQVSITLIGRADIGQEINVQR